MNFTHAVGMTQYKMIEADFHKAEFRMLPISLQSLKSNL